ncbi:MAG: hypothetical protein SPJ01_08925, partial [Butyricicoccus sp.]|nr:hypothetical protein [Butyricicoccus sp.]
MKCTLQRCQEAPGKDSRMIESFCHLADLASGSILNAKALRRLLHFTSGDTLHKVLLNHLN